MPIKKRGSGIPLRGSGGGGGKITVNDHTGEAISTGVTTLEWQTLADFGFTVNVDPDNPSKVIVGAAPVFADPIQWYTAQNTDVRVSDSDLSEVDTYFTGGFEGTVVKGSTSDFIFSSTTGRGFGADAKLSVKTYHAGVLIDDTLFTCNGNGSQVEGNVSINITGYAPDGDGSANVGGIGVTVNGDGLIGSTNSGMCRVEISFLEHKWGERRNLNQDVFRDKNTETPVISGAPSVQEHTDTTKRRIKYLSGIGYYTTDSMFTIDVPTIDGHNEDSSRPSESLMVDSSNFGVTPYTTSPWTDTISWRDFDNTDTTDGVNYTEDVAINEVNYRHVGNALVGNIVRDSWGAANNKDSNTLKICVDTHSNPSTTLVEYFDEENMRLASDYNTVWDSERYCSDGEAVVFNGSLHHGADLPRVLESTTGSLGTAGSLSTYLPDQKVDGTVRQQPNYAVHNRPAVFFRKFLTGDSNSYSSFTMNLTTNGELSSQLSSGKLKIYIWKLGSVDPTSINLNLPPNYSAVNPNTSTVNSLWGHADYNFVAFDDGVSQTAAGSGCIFSQTGNILTLTFGGYSVEDGVLVRFELEKGVRIDEVGVNFV
ncbi:hypothetical protein KUA24_79 [Vibrio phage HNL01]|nr:hypothetical protein KUA24_79 [Vibrio phage HNL01]